MESKIANAKENTEMEKANETKEDELLESKEKVDQ